MLNDDDNQNAWEEVALGDDDFPRSDWKCFIRNKEPLVFYVFVVRHDFIVKRIEFAQRHQQTSLWVYNFIGRYTHI